MRFESRMGLASLLVLLPLLSACGSTEDVRISLCRSLVPLLDPAASLAEPAWAEPQTRHGRFQDLEVEIGYTPDKAAASRMVCVYEAENLPDDNAMTQAEPLSAYRTRPSRVLLDGQPLPDGRLNDAMRRALVQQGEAALEKAGELLQR